MALIPVENVGEVGIVKDINPWQLPPNVWSNGNNVRAMSNTKETEVDALADLDAIKLYESTPGTPNEDGGVPHINNVTGGWPNDPDFVAP